MQQSQMLTSKINSGRKTKSPKNGVAVGRRKHNYFTVSTLHLFIIFSLLHYNLSSVYFVGFTFIHSFSCLAIYIIHFSEKILWKKKLKINTKFVFLCVLRFLFFYTALSFKCRKIVHEKHIMLYNRDLISPCLKIKLNILFTENNP